MRESKAFSRLEAPLSAACRGIFDSPLHSLLYNSAMTRKQTVGVFGALLLTVLLLTILFASGSLRFGLSGPSVYILYLLAGMLAAVLTFGMLSSSGQLNATRGGVTLTLGGSIVALVVVAGGGGIYERYLHRPETFDLLITFWATDPNAFEPLKGQITIYAGNNDFTQALDGSGRNRFLGLPSSLLGKKAELTLNSPGYKVVDMQPPEFTSEGRLRVKVEHAQIFAIPSAEQLSIELAKAQVVDFAPRPDQRIITVGLKFRSTALLPVPLANTVELAVFTESGAPLWETTLKVDRPFVVVATGLSDDSFEAAVDRSKLDQLAGGRLARITMHYEPSVQSGQPIEYSTAMFPISSDTFDDLSKPPK